MTRATLYDGSTAHAHDVRAEVSGGNLRLHGAEDWVQDVDPKLLAIDGDGASQRFTRSDLPGWRLRFLDPPPAELAALLPRPGRYGGFIDRIGIGKAAIVLAGIAAVVLFVGYSSPHWLAPYVPQSWERNLGTAIVGDFGDNRCRSPQGQAALEALAERVSPGVTRGPDAISFAALDIDMVNAAALPGRHVIFFEGMLEDAKSSEELAGVMAHEIAHVRRRHVTEALLRELGIGALVRLFAGGIGANAEQLIGLSYTRANEADADAEAIRMLREAGIDPRPTAELFRRLDPAAARGRSMRIEWLESHPGIAERVKSFSAAYRPGTAYRPALSPEQGNALRNACNANVRVPQPPPANLR